MYGNYITVDDTDGATSSLILTETYFVLTDINEMRCILSNLDNKLESQEFVNKAREHLGKFGIKVKYFADDSIFMEANSHYGDNPKNSLKDNYLVINPTRYMKRYVSKSPFSR